MIAGTLAVLEMPAADPLESYSSGGFATLDVRETQEYLDGSTVQHGRAAATVETETEEIHTSGGSIDVESVPTTDRVWTPWVADVTDAGFVVAERTRPGDRFPFPFDMFTARTGVDVEPVDIDVPQFILNQQDADRDYKVWMVGQRDAEDNTAMEYGRKAYSGDAPDANVGVGFRLPWRATTIKGVLYTSGYVAIYQPSGWGPMQFARFVREELLPVAYIPTDDEETEQDTLGTPTCDDCGRESENLEQHGNLDLCPVCVSGRKEETADA